MAAGSKAAGASPLGPFGALLQALPDIAGGAAEAAGISKGHEKLLSLVTGDAASAAPGLADKLPTALPPGIAMLAKNAGLISDAPGVAPVPAPPDAPLETDALLGELVDIVAALDTALAQGETLDPALRQKLEDVLDALAAFLGVDVAPADPSPPGALQDPLAALAAAQAGTTTPVPGVSPAPASQPGLAAGDVAPQQPPLARLAEKLQSLGEQLQAAAPELSGKLEAIAQKLASGAVDPLKLAGLGIDAKLAFADLELGRLVETLLATPPAAKPVPAPQPFATAALALPEEIVLTPRERPAAAPATSPAAVPDAPTEPEFDPPSLNRPPERQEAADPKLPMRNAFGPATPVPGEQLAADARSSAAAAGAVAAAASVTAGAKAIHAAYQAPVQQINVPQVAFEMVRQFQAGNSRFQIRLDPPELGRVDVRMNMDRDGNVHARLTVERAETLDLMQRDQRALEKALAQAGLDGAKTNLEFSLRQNPSDRDQRGGNGQPSFGDTTAAAPEDPAPAPVITQYRGSASLSGVNLFV